jgi:hypothetical protein
MIPFTDKRDRSGTVGLVYGRTIHPYFWTTGVFIDKNRSPKNRLSAYPSYNEC